MWGIYTAGVNRGKRGDIRIREIEGERWNGGEAGNLTYENDYTNFLLPSILHPCKSSGEGGEFSLILRRGVENRLEIDRPDRRKTNPQMRIFEAVWRRLCTSIMGYVGNGKKRFGGIGEWIRVISLMPTDPSTRPSPLLRPGFLGMMTRSGQASVVALLRPGY